MKNLLLLRDYHDQFKKYGKSMGDLQNNQNLDIEIFSEIPILLMKTFKCVSILHCIR